MLFLTLRKKRLNEFLNAVNRHYRLIAPEQKGSKTYTFRPYSEFPNVALEFLRTIIPPGQFFFPPVERLFSVDKECSITVSPEGEPMWKEEDPFDYIAFIVSGRVKINKESEFGGMNVIMGIYTKGALCILDDSLRKVTAVALEDVSFAIITQENLDKLIATNPGLGAKLLKGMPLTISDRLRKSFDRTVTFF
jgi:CRP-like cAMP-binding protein